jgi:transposase
VKLYAGIDVSLEASSVCLVDETGAIVREAKVASEADALVAWFKALKVSIERIGLEAGPLSQWLYAALKKAGFDTFLMETRHVRDAFASMPVKTDRKDARGIAQLMRLGWFRQVHCKSELSQAMRALLTARSQVQSKMYDLEMTVRGILRGFGLKVGKVSPRDFEARIRELCSGNDALMFINDALLKARAALRQQFAELDKRARQTARDVPAVRLMMSAPGVGSVVGLTYVAAIDDPSRISKSRNAGALFGMTQRKYQSGEIDRTGRISKCGDASVRTALYEAANVILSRPIKGSGSLRKWAMRIAARAGRKKAKVALARKLAVILHRMWRDGVPFDAAKAAA